MNILVTGISGYIGSHVALALAGENVVGIDLVLPHTSLPPGTVFYQGDIGDRELVGHILREHEIDAVCHLAAYVSVEESQRKPDEYLDNNTRKTGVLIDEAKRASVRYFVFSSTAAVYGTPKTIPVKEDAPLSPESVYGQSKLAAEEILRHESDEAFRHVILRYFNVAGADPDGRAGYLVEDGATHLIRRAVLTAVGKLEQIDVYGTDYPTHDGTGVRDYIHVADIAHAHTVALRHLAEGGSSGTYNAGYGTGYSVLEIINAVKKVSGKDFAVRFAPRRDGDVAEVVADATRLRQELGWEPRHHGNLESTIEREYVWVRERVA